ncbi:hypothetical protein SS1G_06146 [Sclerotinia sclerotiorum 1980 UF-70]|uniref:Centrosomin N-terminal motif 1 domain-containing protein n=2 Tax=Sclerotinia sclerotiorum (strain ATCC 18683 / 1980 / Ss-1) TaxID=665079 RepID=A7ELE9_SCLS1|nr:hypothetical protein SS1G_06146 [Sclerotinia sclerotiorum 1980 UF-70]APA09682.1 hypothetical protein sscle_05g044520 [Sclerotinia sclerotiorum 1980 UF-70]EDO03665.1 hypothetical protein SS1G_06146 [Sclerotinia sclerotiorum 1980 UF-70]
MATPTLSSQSTNSSSAHLPLGSGRMSAQSGGAAFLQERLRERKGRERRLSGDFGGSINMAREIESSPVNRGSGGSGVVREREERRPSSSGVGQPGKKSMGVKQMEETVSTLHKQNFDLKLELFHRRQRQEALEAELEHLRSQIQDQTEMQEVNEALLKELEKRDQAVEEAVGIICQLEAQIARLLQEREDVRSFETQYGDDFYDHSNGTEMPSSPPNFDRDTSRTPKGKDTAQVIARMPSFLSEKSEGVEALRSLYLPNTNNYSDVVLPKLPEEGSESGMASPSLSVLSESSFLSVYGEKSSAVNEDFEASPPKQHRRTSSSVEKWIDERPASTMPMRIPSPSPNSSGRRSQFLSMNYVAASPLQRLEKLRSNLEKQYNNSTSMRLKARSEKRDSIQDIQRFNEGSLRLTTDGNGYETSQKLPPTPDTISTGTLRNYKNSDDTLNQRRQANEDEVTFLHNTSTFSVPPATYNPYQSTTSIRPRSAGETVTSRREGHGWDTETLETDELDTLTNYSTDSAAEGTKIHPPTRQPQSGNQTPEFFSFNTTSRERDTMRAWGVDGTYNDYPTTRVPSGSNSGSRASNSTARRYEILRALSQAETHPKSDGTITSGYLDRRPQSRVEDRRERHFAGREIERSSTPLDEKTSKPPAPDRRSSLAAATSKLRKHVPASINTSHDSNPKMPLAPVSASIPNTPRENSKEKEGSKEKDFRRLLPTRLFFGRSETEPTNNSNSTSSSSSNSNIDRRTKYQTMPMRNSRYSSRRTDLSDYQLNGSDESGNMVEKTTYFEEDDVEVERERSATPPPISRNRMHSTQIHREHVVRPRSACAGVMVSARERRRFGGDGAHDGDEVVRGCISGAGAGGEKKGIKALGSGSGSGSGMGREKRENAQAEIVKENSKENNAVKEKENSSASIATPGHGRKWFGLAHVGVGVGRSGSVSRR